MFAGELQPHTLEIVELAALRGRAEALRAVFAGRDAMSLPDMGRAIVAGDRITLCVRPERWMILSGSPQTPGGWKSPQSPGGSEARAIALAAGSAVPAVSAAPAVSIAPADSAVSAARRLRVSSSASEWQQACEGVAVAVDLSAALTAFRLSDASTLAGACRLDLDPQIFPVGHAAATIIAQVSVILARRATDMLLLTPSTTARHFQEWLGEHIR